MHASTTGSQLHGRLVFWSRALSQFLLTEQRSLPLTAEFGADSAWQWYEIAKIQTWGGAIFEKNCVCTTLDVAGISNSTDASVVNSCRNLTPTGDWINATGTLLNQSPPGHWEESFFLNIPQVRYVLGHAASGRTELPGSTHWR